MTVRGDRRIGGITIGGILVIIGIVVALVWSVVLGVIIASLASSRSVWSPALKTGRGATSLVGSNPTPRAELNPRD